MNCERMAENITGLISGTLSSAQTAECKRHLGGCRDCTAALRGAEALALLKACDTGDVPPGLFDSVLNSLDTAREPRHAGQKRFWLGTGFGGAIAASLFAVALTLGWIGAPDGYSPDVAEFYVALGEPRTMDLAIETDRPLEGARISILLAGGVELEGYGVQRELSWTSDLKAGVNRLSLPIVAVDRDGGRVVVRLSHPESEQIFVVRLRTSA
ncbi:MAG TPA: hypothetical protein VMO24_05295 [Woeseiaceae bacterium]|nr:hypothetical protein [Woeseiaceae bacterium]